MIFNIYKFMRFILILILLVDMSSFFFIIKESNIVTTKNISQNVAPVMQQEHIMIMKSKYRSSEPKIKVEEIQMPNYNIKLSKRLQEYTWNLCLKYKVNYELILGMLKLESNFNIHQVSRNSNRTYDRGIAQINSKYQKYNCELVGIQEFDPYCPEKSIELCIKLMAHYNAYWINKGVNEDKIHIWSMGTYNRGLEGYKEYMRVKGTPHTAYSRIVIKNMIELKKYSKFRTE
jgi:hypothetical protein